MKIAAVIAEYNPFHNGHAYQLQRIKDHYGYDFVIVVMSGNFTQRGEPAIADKYTRTQMALLSGADLVIELPAYYACASAEYFATGAVSLIHGLGCVDALFFGSESEDTDSSSPNPPALLLHAANILLEEPDSYRSALSDTLKRGKSYAAARMDALMAALQEDGLSESCAARAASQNSCAAQTFSQELNPAPAIQPTSHLFAILSLPNNTLGMEYCKAILRMNSPLKPFAIKRIGSGYHDVAPADTYASAEAIRTLLSANDAFSALVPHTTAQVLAGLSRDNLLLTQNDFSEMLHYQLLLHESELERYADCTPELANRIRSLLPSLLTETTTDMIETIKTKSYTYTRINRVLTHLLLDMTSDTFSALTDKSAPAFLTHARILGFRKEACGSLLSAVKESARIPLITKPADYHPTGIEASLYQSDLLASHIYQSVAAKKSAQAFRHELTRSPLIV